MASDKLDKWIEARAIVIGKRTDFPSAVNPRTSAALQALRSMLPLIEAAMEWDRVVSTKRYRFNDAEVALKAALRGLELGP